MLFNWGLGVGYIVTATIQARYLAGCENLAQHDNPEGGGKNWLRVLVNEKISMVDVCTYETLSWNITIAVA